MIATNVTRDTLEAAAELIGVRAEIEALNAKGTRHRVKLYPTVPDTAWQIDFKRTRTCPSCGLRVTTSPIVQNQRYYGLGDALYGSCGHSAPPERWARRRWKDERGDSPYQRESVGYMTAGRRVHAVCWHGFRDYFRAVFEREPNAVFHTAVATWKGKEHFEANYRASGDRNIGPPIAPVLMADACRCPERGMAL